MTTNDGRYYTNYGGGNGRSHVLAFKITHDGLFTMLENAGLAYVNDCTTSGEKDIPKPVHVIWDGARNAMGNKSQGNKSFHVGVSGWMLKEMVDKWIPSIEDVTERAHQHAAAVNSRDFDTAEAICAETGEQYIDIGDAEIEWRLGML